MLTLNVKVAVLLPGTIAGTVGDARAKGGKGNWIVRGHAQVGETYYGVSLTGILKGSQNIYLLLVSVNDRWCGCKGNDVYYCRCLYKTNI